MKEQLYDGPLDGLEVLIKGDLYSPCLGLNYVRRADGKMYLVGSRWE